MKIKPTHHIIIPILLFFYLLVSLTACQSRSTPSSPLSESFIRKAEEGGLFLLGRYEQDNNLENGPEDIEWIVLEKDDKYITAISKYALECMSFHESETWEKTDWETCTVRQWLNSDFYNSAFSSEEKKFICPVELENPDSYYFNIEGGNNTIDYVSLLDKETIQYLYEDIEFQVVRFTFTPDKPDDHTVVEKTMTYPYDAYEPLIARYTDYATQKFISSLRKFENMRKTL